LAVPYSVGYTLSAVFWRTLICFVMTLALLGQASFTSARTPDDTFYSRQWYLPQIGAPRAWDRTTGSPVVVVAVIDTAMDIDHEDLKDNIWMNAKEIFGNGADDDGNGYVDDVHGWNFTNNSNDVRPHGAGATEHGYIHATLVASLIAAKGNNATGIAGVAWNARIMPLVALDAEGGGSTADVGRAIRYAADNGASIINLSLEGYADASEVDDALVYARSKGVLTVSAAGNAEVPEGIDLDKVRVYPACLSLDAQYGTIGVGSTDVFDERAYYANYGSCIQVSAPGDDLFGAKPSYGAAGTSSTQAVSGYGGGYSGTHYGERRARGPSSGTGAPRKNRTGEAGYCGSRVGR
jgi:subtilisin family serine protease